MTRVS